MILKVLTPLETIIQETIDYTRQRKAFDQSVLQNQVVHFRLAELATEVELLRSLLYRTIGEFPCLPPQMCFLQCKEQCQAEGLWGDGCQTVVSDCVCLTVLFSF